MRDVFLIEKPLITEKSTDLMAVGKYVFIVKPTATKNEVKKAIKDIYKVDAAQVNIVRLPKKTRFYRGLSYQKAGLKKAIVTLKEGQKIDLGR